MTIRALHGQLAVTQAKMGRLGAFNTAGEGRAASCSRESLGAKLDAVPMGLNAEAMQDDATELLSECSGCRLTAVARS